MKPLIKAEEQEAESNDTDNSGQIKSLPRPTDGLRRYLSGSLLPDNNNNNNNNHFSRKKLVADFDR